MTEWRSIEGWPGYEVSSDGRVRSLDRTVNKHFLHGKELRTKTDSFGYQCLGLSLGGVQKKLSVHRLVCAAFHGPPPSPRHQVRHLNGDPADNHAENLAWGTASENQLDRLRHGTHHNAAKTHCVHGHPFDEANTYWRDTPHGLTKGRHCRACNRVAARRAAAARALRSGVSQ